MHHSLNFPIGFLKRFLPLWLNIQTLLPKVIRWQKYISSEDRHGGARIQNSLQHSYSIGVFAIAVIYQLSLRISNIDEVLLRDAVLIHDIGEGDPDKDEQGDTHYIDKTEQGDLGEYLQFLDRVKDLEPGLLNVYKRAFLLQFALKNPESFPADAREIMTYLASEKTIECHIFNAIERLDYVLFAVEQYEARDNVKILLQTLRGQVPHLNELADKTLPEISNDLWTPKLRRWCENFIKDHEGRLIEEKEQAA